MRKELAPKRIFEELERAQSYNSRIELYENVKKNEDFYIGDQWKGVYAPDLEKPVLIIMDMIRCYYGVREVFFDTGEGSASTVVDFSAFDPESMELKVDVGPASYWSELVQVETADNLYKNGIITDAVTYLETVPGKYIRNKRRLIDRLERARAAERNPELGMRN